MESVQSEQEYRRRENAYKEKHKVFLKVIDKDNSVNHKRIRLT